jgi:hypothetical protein
VVVNEHRLPAGRAPAESDSPLSGTASPFSGVRVLDITRVIAGPVCTKFLAAYSAEVLRLDPPGFAEVPAAGDDGGEADRGTGRVGRSLARPPRVRQPGGDVVRDRGGGR